MPINPATFQSGGRASQHYIPGAYSRIDFQRGAGGLASLSNAVILGKSDGGEPNKLYWFGAPSQAEDVLRSGTLLEAVKAAFEPGGGVTPQQIAAMRVNTAEQSTYDLQLGETTIVTLKSWDWGRHTVQIKLKLEDGSNNGKKLTVGYKNQDPIVEDDIYRESLSILYTGSGTSAEMDISSGTLTTTVDSTEDLSITLSDYDSMENLVNYINDQADYTCELLTEDPSDLPENLDHITSEDITTEYTATSSLQELIERAEDIPWIGSAEYNDAAGDRTLPDNITSWAYFTGGTNGDYTSTEWEDSLEKLEEENVQLVGASTTEESIHLLIKAHCNTMNSVDGKNERQAILGGPTDETEDAVITRAANLNSEYVSLCYPEYQDYNDAGEVAWFSPMYYAAKELGRVTVLNLPEPCTNKEVGVLAFKTLSRTSQRNLIKNGVWVGARSRDGRNVNVRSLTTYQSGFLQKNEFSIMRTSLAVSRDLRTTIEGSFIGRAMTNSLLSDVDSTVTMRLTLYTELGWFLGTEESEAWWGYKRLVNGDQIKIEYNANVTPPSNFIFITSKLGVVANIGE